MRTLEAIVLAVVSSTVTLAIVRAVGIRARTTAGSVPHATA